MALAGELIALTTSFKKPGRRLGPCHSPDHRACAVKDAHAGVVGAPACLSRPES